MPSDKQIADFSPRDFIDQMGQHAAGWVRSELRHDKSYTIIIVGKERMGKTTFSAIFGCLIDPTLCLRRCVFPTAELKKAIHEQPEHCYRVVLQDEGAETWLSGDALSGDAKDMVRYFMETGYKNLCVIINIPDVSRVQSYLKSHRADCLIRIVHRGVYAFYSEVRLRGIHYDQTSKRVIWPTPNFYGHFKKVPNSSFMRALELKKRKHLGHKELNPAAVKMIEQQEKMRAITIDTNTAAKMLGLKPPTFYKHYKEKRFKKLGIEPLITGMGSKRRRWWIKDVRQLQRVYGIGFKDTLLDSKYISD